MAGKDVAEGVKETRRVWIAENWSYEGVAVEGVYEDFEDALSCHHILKTDPEISWDEKVYYQSGKGGYHGFRITPHNVIPSSHEPTPCKHPELEERTTYVSPYGTSIIGWYCKQCGFLHSEFVQPLCLKPPN